MKFVFYPELVSIIKFQFTRIRRNVHASTYDKDIDEHLRANVVPDEVIAANSDKYWGPNPKTGVFGPANPSDSARPAGHAGDGTSSVLDQKVWFRPSEDLN
ncbi:hypothetical protein FCM35_KLT13764 [Carex littledalei]|uniref:Uncharacterized protein n=1 Tax=Carex littledalei TaxID=544730 RepID=A0A833QKK2_9POAL|nr:hypothetical protein FCM35_KLT13764 [Carex littledalei]